MADARPAAPAPALRADHRPGVGPESSADAADAAGLLPERRALIPLGAAIDAAARRVRARSDRDAVHDLRVACRRLEGALLLWEPALDAHAAVELRHRVRWLRRRLSRTRDAEVEWARLRRLPLPAGTLVRQRIGRWLESRHRRRARRLARAARLAGERRIGRLHEALLALAVAPARAATRRGAGVAPGAGDRTLVSVRRRLVLRLAQVRRAAREATTSSGPRLHALRIAIKKCRYTLESWEAVSPSRSPLALAPLVAAQRRLGELRDAELLALRLARRQRRWSARGRPAEARWAQRHAASLARERAALWRAFRPERLALLSARARRSAPASR
jgi:CHAD domain-containing protein